MDATIDLPRVLRRSQLHLIKGFGFLVPKLIPARAITCISGDPGSYKSFIMIGVACSLATKSDCFGKATKKQRKVAYVVGEAASGLHQRISAWEKVNRLTVPDTHFMARHLGLSLNDKVQFREFCQELGDFAGDEGVDLIVLDTLSQTLDGDENSAAMTIYLKYATQLVSTFSSSVVIIHHPTKSGSDPFRGYGSLRGNIDCGIVVTMEDEINKLIKLSMKPPGKAPRDSEVPDDLFLQWVKVDLCLELGYGEDGEPVSSGVLRATAERPPAAKGNSKQVKTSQPRLTLAEQARKFYEDQVSLFGGGTKAEMIERCIDYTKCAKSTAYNVLAQMEREGCLVVTNGVYAWHEEMTTSLVHSALH